MDETAGRMLAVNEFVMQFPPRNFTALGPMRLFQRRPLAHGTAATGHRKDTCPLVPLSHKCLKQHVSRWYSCDGLGIASGCPFQGWAPASLLLAAQPTTQSAEPSAAEPEPGLEQSVTHTIRKTNLLPNSMYFEAHGCKSHSSRCSAGPCQTI